MHQKHHADYHSKTAADTALVGDTDHDEEYLAAAAAAAAAESAALAAAAVMGAQ